MCLRELIDEMFRDCGTAASFCRRNGGGTPEGLVARFINYAQHPGRRKPR